MIVAGNLLTDPAAQSFVTVAEADAYLAPEHIEAWDIASETEREAALVRASRWLAGTYRFNALTETGVLRLGHVAARLAAETIGKPLFAGTDTGAVVESEKVGPVAVTYKVGLRADAAGMAWPWLLPMLDGLIQSSSTSWLMRA